MVQGASETTSSSSSLFDDDLLDAAAALQRVFEVFDLLLQVFDVLQPLQDELPVQVTQLDLRDILGLDLIDAEADHQVRHDLRFLFGLADDLDGFIDVEQDLLETL